MSIPRHITLLARTATTTSISTTTGKPTLPFQTTTSAAQTIAGPAFLAKPMYGAQGVEGTRSLGGFDWAYALDRGARVGPKRPFSALYLLIAGLGVCWSAGSNWCNVTNHYLGLSFKIPGQTHYGWARLNVSFNPKNLKITATLTGYTYDPREVDQSRTDFRHFATDSRLPEPG